MFKGLGGLGVGLLTSSRAALLLNAPHAPRTTRTCAHHAPTARPLQGEVEALRGELRERLALQEVLKHSAASITTFLSPMWVKVHTQLVIAAEKKAAAKAGKDKKK